MSTNWPPPVTVDESIKTLNVFIERMPDNFTLSKSQVAGLLSSILSLNNIQINMTSFVMSYSNKDKDASLAIHQQIMRDLSNSTDQITKIVMSFSLEDGS